MPTPIKPIRRPQQFNQGRDWKDHPLVVAVISAASTAVFFMTVVLPLRVDLLTAKVERLTTTSAEAMATAEKLERAEKDLAEARTAQRLATISNPFASRSVYPIGLDRAVLGTPVGALMQRYPNGKWDEENAYYSVKGLEDAVVHSATYYFDGNGEKRTVKFILFHLKPTDTTSSDIAYKHFLSTFGEPIVGRRKKQLWKATEREWVVLDAARRYASTYHVYPPAYSMALIDFDGVAKK